MYTFAMTNSSSTLYRNYRPTKFSESRGQEQIVSVLENQIKNKRPAHAYLFSGGRGTGKTTFARILAHELGVSDKDLIEMDAASNRGIDDIRELREGVYALPFESPYKLYIIDEAHMLTKDAWNALLKTLEEPPAHVIFVLATTEKDKVPDTIQSRCEIYTFKQPSREILSNMVSDVAHKEGYSLDKAAAELLALLADGSFRDALSILQKVLSVAKEKKITREEVELVSGAPSSELVRELLQSIAKKDTERGLKAIHTAIEAHMDTRVLTRFLIHRLRLVLLVRYAPEIAHQLSEELNDADVVFAQNLSKEPGINSDALRQLLEAYSIMAYAAVPHLPLELAMIDLGQVSSR